MTPLELRFFLEVASGTTGVRKLADWAAEKTGVKTRTVLSYLYNERPAPAEWLVKLGVPESQIPEDKSPKLDHFIRAVKQFCVECSDDACWDATCSLRPVSPLPLRAKK